MSPSLPDWWQNGLCVIIVFQSTDGQIPSQEEGCF